jgi:ankyrin repeat protein
MATSQDPLWIAVFSGDRGKVNLLLDAGANVNTEDEDDGLSLIDQLLLCSPCDFKMLTLLLGRGARVDGNKTRGLSPLGIACQFADVTAAAILIGFGAETSISTPSHVGTPIKVAVRGNVRLGSNFDATHDPVVVDPHDQTMLVRLLLAHEVDLFVTSGKGKTLLMTAAQRGNSDVVRLLIGAGLDPEACDDAGSTAVDYARRAVQHENERILLEEIRRGFCCEAFALENLPRAGEHSLVEMLKPDLVSKILDIYNADWISLYGRQ